ncbi:Pyridoxamine 5'-phosphate oxidase [Halovenus aranensis]|jgi:nitroimidazol reductase NimA-like FMN-containing flavoprotein (pyridoxamine 5'-phosphate oxidase superfamily)|uniref:Pyridoxamine 5'-phosphate oxidase n=1 Tax=Halovenus aranensis TaxID=890420 RepID=A0A1G8VBH1_9EURY|nr:pyridoxamine 5'-phosphate oxidase family protein [Halovenus aranensis]SDJ63353.1 Pyridoxamine 5'-phosphate oxidase [Halovenus aranensis]
MKPLSDDVIATVLERNGVGVLAINGDNAPYQVPMCFGYVPDEDLFVLQMTGGETSDKKRHLQENQRVSVTVYEETEPGQRWRSVVVRGVLSECSYQDAERGFAALANNSQSVPNPISWADSPERTELTPYQLDITERGGREFDLR